MNHPESRNNEIIMDPATSEPDALTPRRPYLPPVLTRYGNIETLTLDLVTGPDDGGIAGTQAAG